MRTAYQMRDMVFYDDDGNEIPDEELPWSSDAKEPDPCDDLQDWMYLENGNRSEDAFACQKNANHPAGYTLRCRTKKARGAECARGGASQVGNFSPDSNGISNRGQLV